ncbi:MAG: ABC transporter substrate-binding protein [Chitinophagaceae bacterium]|nr:ABC transporter substrate-binding protein [Anaerolineae bacterium]
MMSGSISRRTRYIASLHYPHLKFNPHYLALVLLLLGSLISACAVVKTKSSFKVALIAPFEGRYREIGYQALYAVRLHSANSTFSDKVQLLPIDDGGSVENAVDRARALANDPQVIAVIALGYAATAPETQAAYGDLPVIVAGYWGTYPTTDNIFIRVNPAMPALFTVSPRIEIVEAAQLPTDRPLWGGEVFALEQFPQLRDDLSGITLLSSVELPNARFRELYMASDPFAPEPNLIAALAYEARNDLWGRLYRHFEFEREVELRPYLVMRLQTTRDFLHGFLPAMPIYTYTYNSQRQLIPIDGVVEQR